MKKRFATGMISIFCLLFSGLPLSARAEQNPSTAANDAQQEAAEQEKAPDSDKTASKPHSGSYVPEKERETTPPPR